MPDNHVVKVGPHRLTANTKIAQTKFGRAKSCDNKLLNESINEAGHGCKTQAQCVREDKQEALAHANP